MTRAVCIFCGNMKIGCFVKCKACGAYPGDGLGRVYSLVYSDHHYEMEDLDDISKVIRETGQCPSLHPDDEKRALEHYRMFIEKG